MRKSCFAVAATLIVAATSLDARSTHPAPGRAQGAPDPSLVTILMVDDLGVPDARAVVVRRARQTPPNVILVTARTTPADLAHAVGALMRSRQTQGEAVTRDMRAHISPTTTKAGRARNEERAARDLTRLGGASVRQIEGIGRGRSITVRMKAETAAEGASGSRRR